MVDNFKLELRGKLQSANYSLPSTAPKNNVEENQGVNVPKKKFIKHFYDKERHLYCGRTCKSWLCIIAYGFIYLTFLSTFTLVLLYISLYFIKETVEFKHLEPMHLTYSESTTIGLSATPASEDSYPLIWYKQGEKNEYEKYVHAIDRLLLNNINKTNVVDLGPCGQSPYGYGDNPCIILRINKQFYWSGKPLHPNSTDTKLAPLEVQNWIRTNNNRLWLHCNGYHSYDKEHIGSIKYYPDPPGFNPDVFPLQKEKKSPLIAIQITNFTKGISLAVECKLWYIKGPSSIEFILYVAPADSITVSSQK